MKKKIKTSKLMISFFLALSVAGTAIAQELSNKNASEDAKQVYQYISTRNSFDTNRLFSGQNCYHGNQIVGGYTEYFKGLFDLTGRYPAFLGVDYEYVKRFSVKELSETNAVFIKHWKSGGLVTINWAPFNPWTGGDNRDLRNVNLNELVDPTSAAYSKWHAELDRIATGLAELRDSGVVVVWRPLQEMNSDWFWWGVVSHPEDKEPFSKVWQDMHHYFSVDKGLNNLIWELSVVEPINNHGIDFYYPGDDVVDIVGTSVYKTPYANYNYGAMLALGKPIAACETGPADCCMDGTWDNMCMVNGIRENSPNTMYFLNWHDWVDHKASILNNLNSSDLLNDPWVITRDEVNWKNDITNNSPMVEVLIQSGANSINKGDNLLISADASDSDGEIVKVQFFNGYEKIGEDTQVPYEFEFTDVPGGVLHINVRAIDNKNAVTQSQTINVTSVIPSLPYTNLVINGEFDSGISSWGSWGNNGTNYTINADDKYNVTGRNSLRAEMVIGGADGWMCQLMQGLELKTNVEYEIGFKAKANKKAKLEVQLGQNYSPYGGYWFKSVSLDTIAKVFGPYNYKNYKNDKEARILFNLGGQNATTIWLDSIIVYEKVATPVSVVNYVNNQAVSLTIYPNPVKSQAAVEYTLPQNGKIKLSIYNSLGREIKLLIDDFKMAGKYKMEFDVSSFNSGIYFYCLSTDKSMIFKKIIISK